LGLPGFIRLHCPTYTTNNPRVHTDLIDAPAALSEALGNCS
jgi:hypothetical protein